MFVHGRCDSKMWNGSECCQVEGSMVCWSVFAHQSCPVETEHYMQFEQCHIVYDIIESTLCKGAVDIAEGDEPVFRHSP